LVRRLQAEGYAVRALLHSRANDAAALPANGEIVFGDITNVNLVSEAVRGVDLVFHLAAKLHIENPPPELTDEYVRVNVEGTRCLVEAAAAAKCERLIFFSTINVYGPTACGEIVSEDAELHPDSLYAETKVCAEEIVRQLAGTVVLRAAAVYGPAMKGNFPRLVRAMKKGLPVLVGQGNNRRTMIYVEDLCRAAMVAAEHPAAPGQTFNISDGCVHRLRDVINAISDALGQARSTFRLPEFALRAGAGIIEQSFGVVGKRAPISRATIDKLTEDMAVSSAKIQKQLGFRPQYNLAEGWRETIRLMESRG
jgi:UDP-glucose 4-epimerase